MDDPERALEQCRRVLRPGGRLGLTDLYARGQPARLAGCLGRLETREALHDRLEAHGFRPARFADHSPLLRAYACQMLLERGAGALQALTGGGLEAMREARAGYCLILAVREDRP
jgi:SAM-dependent methyltransferase